MSEAIVTLPDGRKAKVTFESQEQLDATVNDLVEHAQPAAEPPTKPVDNRPVGDLADVIMDPLRVVGTSAVAAPVAGIAGLGAAAGKAMGLTDAQPEDVVERVQAAMTYQPRTKVGQATTRALMWPFEKLTEGADWLGQKVADATGSPAAGAAVKTAVQIVPAVALRRAPGGKSEPKAADLSLVEESAPTQTAIPAQAPPVQTTVARPAQRSPAQATEPAYVAPDLVLQTEARNRPSSAKIDPTQKAAETRARDYVTRTAGVDWNALPREVQASLVEVAKDANNLATLDARGLARQVQLQALPKPVPATQGQLTRDPVQLRNEGNVSATKAGEPIRQIHLDQNQALLDNLDILKGRVANKTNPAQTAEAVGISVQDQALRAKLELSRRGVKEKYAAAEAAGELQAKASPVLILRTIAASPDKTHFGWVQSWMNEMGVVQKTTKGTITRKLTLKEMEDLRQAAVARAMDGGTEGFYAGKVISAIDQATEGVGGNLYKEARAARRAQALEFEETGAIARLVENKSRTDRATALEDTWRKTVIGGSVQDLRNVKRSLLTGGDRQTRSAGKRAWRDVKAQTMQYIKDEATKGVALNERGQPNVTPAAMKRAIDSIGKEKIDEIFGSGTAVQLNRIMEAARTVKTVPPAGHAGSSTMSNLLSFLERGLGRVPVIGDVGAGAIRAGVQLKQMGEAGRLSREAQRTPLSEAEQQRIKNTPLDY
jgi:hypothetical protein